MKKAIKNRNKSFCFKNLNIVSFKNNLKTTINANRKIYSLNKSLINKIDAFCEEHSISDYIFLLSNLMAFVMHILNYLLNYNLILLYLMLDF